MSARGRLQAPRTPGSVLAEPPLGEVAACLRQNHRRLDHAECTILGRPLAELRKEARQAALAAARDYFRGAGEPWPDFAGTESLLLAGHQPELFHPGVWVKNFALNALARQHGGIALNLVVDTDLVKTTDLKVPAWEGGRSLGETSPQAVHRVSVPFDHGRRDLPYEERRVQDEKLFAELPDRIGSLTPGWPFEPLLSEFWEDVGRAAARTELLGERLASARRSWERRWGCHNAEVPVSRLCQTETFAWFACHLLSEASRFHALYNDSVHQYRRRNGIKNRSHPVPDLARAGEWLEMPFWAWKASGGQRGRLMVRREGDALEIRLAGDVLAALPLRPDDAVAAWGKLAQAGIKLRSRALTTTLFARLFLGDVFAHGIGGAKYDEITDALIQGFYGVEPPEYLVLSATLLLPFPAYGARPEDVRRQAWRLRDLWWNPQRHAALNGKLAPLAAEKQRLARSVPESAPERRERFRQLRAVTAELRALTSHQIEQVRAELEQARQQMHANAVLQRRDYAFPFYPAGMLRDFFGRLLSDAAATAPVHASA